MKFNEVSEALLKAKLVEKHKRFQTDYAKKRKDLERLFILEDKIDQLSHWIENVEGEDVAKLSSERQKAEEELNTLKSRLGALSHKNTTELEEKIHEHEQALAYWSTR